MVEAWDCEAYGPEGREHGMLCFIAGDLGRRVCPSAAACHEVIAAERRRVFSRIQELAAHGDPAGEYLAGEVASPEQLLGGGTEEPGDEEEADG